MSFLVPQINQTFTATHSPILKRKSHSGLTGMAKKDMWYLEWETFQPRTYKLISQQVIDNDTDREFTLLRDDGIVTEVEANWFNTELTGRKINLVV